jgi:hypothetical protein
MASQASQAANRKAYADARRVHIERLATPRVRSYRGEVVVGQGSYSFVTTRDQLTVHKHMLADESPWIIELLSQLRVYHHVNVLHPKVLSMVRRAPPTPHSMMPRSPADYVSVSYRKYPSTLATHIDRLARSSWHIRTDIVRGLLVVIERMHANGVCHRDIKPENILTCVRSDGTHRAVLCDFSASTTACMTKTRVCSLDYRAPELLHADQRYGSQAPIGTYDNRIDHFALGMVLYKYCMGENFAETLAAHVGAGSSMCYNGSVYYHAYRDIMVSGSYIQYVRRFLEKREVPADTIELVMRLIALDPNVRGPLWVQHEPQMQTYEQFSHKSDAYGVPYGDIAVRNICENLMRMSSVIGCDVNHRVFVNMYREVSTVLERNDMEIFAAVYWVLLCKSRDVDVDIKDIVRGIKHPGYSINVSQVVKLTVMIFIAYGINLWEMLDSANVSNTAVHLEEKAGDGTRDYSPTKFDALYASEEEEGVVMAASAAGANVTGADVTGVGAGAAAGANASAASTMPSDEGSTSDVSAKADVTAKAEKRCC